MVEWLSLPQFFLAYNRSLVKAGTLITTEFGFDGWFFRGFVSSLQILQQRGSNAIFQCNVTLAIEFDAKITHVHSIRYLSSYYW